MAHESNAGSTLSPDAREVLDAHRAAGRFFEAEGVRSFTREQGHPLAAPVVLVHGVPTSSFLYRKLIPRLADEGLRAIAFDFPGLGLAERPDSFDYSWSGLAKWMGSAIDALALGRCHLVVHDIGGPIGCEWAVRNPDRVLSLTALNTMLDPVTFRRPWSMRPFAMRGIGPIYLRATPRAAFAWLFRLQGVEDRSAIGRPEIDVYHHLLRHDDGGRAFLRIMRGFELNGDKRRFLWSGLAERRYPARIVWGEKDPALGRDQLEIAKRVLAVDDPTLLPAKHFLQEDQAPAIANVIGDLVAPLG